MLSIILLKSLFFIYVAGEDLVAVEDGSNTFSAVKAALKSVAHFNSLTNPVKSAEYAKRKLTILL